MGQFEQKKFDMAIDISPLESHRDPQTYYAAMSI